MRKAVFVASILIWGIAATAGLVKAETYTFTWSNSSPTTICSPLEILVLNAGGSVLDQKYSGTSLKYQVDQKMELNASYCARITVKALCSGSNINQTIGCMGGTLLITSPSGMTFVPAIR